MADEDVFTPDANATFWSGSFRVDPASARFGDAQHIIHADPISIGPVGTLGNQ